MCPKMRTAAQKRAIDAYHRRRVARQNALGELIELVSVRRLGFQLQIKSFERGARDDRNGVHIVFERRVVGPRLLSLVGRWLASDWRRRRWRALLAARSLLLDGRLATCRRRRRGVSRWRWRWRWSGIRLRRLKRRVCCLKMRFLSLRAQSLHSRWSAAAFGGVRRAKRTSVACVRCLDSRMRPFGLQPRSSRFGKCRKIAAFALASLRTSW